MRKSVLPYLMLSPFLILVILFFVAPVIITAIMAFTDMNSAMQWHFIGFENFRKIVNDPNFLKLITNTFKYVGGTLLINVGFAFLLAILSSYFIKREKPGMIFNALWMLPRISPPVVYILLWLWMFDPSQYGLLNALRALIFNSPPKEWLTNHAMLSIIIVNGFVGASFGMIIFSSAIKSISQDLFKAAKLDGASEWSIVMDIILPSIKWPVMFVTIWQSLSLLTSYEYILLLTGGGPMFDSEVWSLYAFHKAFKNFEFGYGAALSLVLVVVALIITIIMLKVFGFKQMMRSSRIDEG